MQSSRTCALEFACGRFWNFLGITSHGVQRASQRNNKQDCRKFEFLKRSRFQANACCQWRQCFSAFVLDSRRMQLAADCEWELFRDSHPSPWLAMPLGQWSQALANKLQFRQNRRVMSQETQSRACTAGSWPTPRPDPWPDANTFEPTLTLVATQLAAPRPRGTALNAPASPYPERPWHPCLEVTIEVFRSCLQCGTIGMSLGG